MLRFLVLLLLLANGFFYAWSAGYLSQWGWFASTQRESYRLNEQLEPERISIPSTTVISTNTTTATSTTTPSIPVSASTTTTTTTTTTTSTTSTSSTICLTAGAFNERQSNALQQALASKMPDVKWRFEAAIIPARWIVYMGKYPNAQARDVKKTQLKQLNVSFEALNTTALEPGISLGGHPDQSSADQALQSLIKKGVRTARVLQESPEQAGQTWVAPVVDDATRIKINNLYASMLSQLGNSPLQICK